MGDTIRKKSKVSENIEFYSVMRAIRAIENSDVCLLIIDAQRGVEAQDLSIFNIIQKNSKGYDGGWFQPRTLA